MYRLISSHIIYPATQASSMLPSTLSSFRPLRVNALTQISKAPSSNIPRSTNVIPENERTDGEPG